jgi:hypothetical protein
MRRLLILGAVLVTGCQTPDPPQSNTSASNIPAVSTTPPAITRVGPNCYNVPYAEKKAAHDSKSPIPGRTADNTPIFQPLPQSRAERIIIQSNRLPTPPEIAAIERGYTYHWVGGFINDGLATWTGIDLDRRLFINVQRRVWDARAQMSRRFSDPVFPDYDTTSFARKWATDQRVETEVVQIRIFYPDEMSAFVCVANGAWLYAPDKSQRAFTMMSDTLINETVLYDRQFEQGQGVLYKKKVDYDSPLQALKGPSAPLSPFKWEMQPR